VASSSNTLHEAPDKLSSMTQDLHRAIVSLQEELEAVDWYQQRADACEDAALRNVLLHNMREEIEHASMILEWIRRHHPDFNRHLRTYLFTDGPITEIEAEDTAPTSAPADTAAPAQTQRLTVGTMKEE
jgi:ferritin-like protein